MLTTTCTTRRGQLAFCLVGACVLWSLTNYVGAAEADGQTLIYRGFTADVSTIGGMPDAANIIASLRHQIDIVADCGARPDIINFFRSRKITVEPTLGDEPGRFVEGRGITVDVGAQQSNQPILLHEFLHAFHLLMLPAGYQNPDIRRFYNDATKGRRYPAETHEDKYILKDQKEFFAVTASLYLWGNVDRQPRSRENLKTSQPAYYAWLGQQFDVAK